MLFKTEKHKETSPLTVTYLKRRLYYRVMIFISGPDSICIQIPADRKLCIMSNINLHMQHGSGRLLYLFFSFEVKCWLNLSLTPFRSVSIPQKLRRSVFNNKPLNLRTCLLREEQPDSLARSHKTGRFLSRWTVGHISTSWYHVYSGRSEIKEKWRPFVSTATFNNPRPECP